LLCCLLCLLAPVDFDIVFHAFEGGPAAAVTVGSDPGTVEGIEDPFDDNDELLRPALVSDAWRTERPPSRGVFLAPPPPAASLPGAFRLLPPCAIPLSDRSEHAGRNGLGAPLLC